MSVEAGLLGPRAEEVAVAFVGALRRSGITVPVQSTVTFLRAIAELDPTSRAALYWAGRATLVVRPEDVAGYDRVFDSFWRRLDSAPELVGVADEPLALVFEDESVGQDDELEATDREPADAEVLAVRYSPHEVLRRRDLAGCSPEELAEVARLMRRFRFSVARQRSRRHQPTRRRTGRPDLRATLRRSIRSGGEPIERAHARPGERPRRVVLLLDVSGSMEAYSRALLRFVHAAVAGRSRVEAFALGTRLTRITRELATRDPDEALTRAVGAASDWSGGTRLGEVIAQFNQLWGVRGMARGAIVVILSDGWDRGDPELLDAEMARLGRVAAKVIWVNPLKATVGYEPLARGMAAALPHVDRFVEGHSLDALERLAEELGL